MELFGYKSSKNTKAHTTNEKVLTGSDTRWLETPCINYRIQLKGTGPHSNISTIFVHRKFRMYQHQHPHGDDQSAFCTLNLIPTFVLLLLGIHLLVDY